MILLCLYKTIQSLKSYIIIASKSMKCGWKLAVRKLRRINLNKIHANIYNLSNNNSFKHMVPINCFDSIKSGDKTYKDKQVWNRKPALLRRK